MTKEQVARSVLKFMGGYLYHMGQQPQTAADARPNWRDACLVVLDLAALSDMLLVLDHHGKAHPVLCV